MDIFSRCHEINDLINVDEKEARNKVILLLNEMELAGVRPTPIVNKMIREVGLYPYILNESASWQERYVCNAFSADIGAGDVRVLHREQARLLGELLSGENVAVSAPTSFGKSFVIDAYISSKNPKNIVIIVPTIALMDETRRRLTSKFGRKYKMITSPEQELSENNILIFPQERASSYFDTLKEIDFLVIDEFYKASKDFDKERCPALVRAIVKFTQITKQRYFLAPNIDGINGDHLTKGMKFIKLDFNTVFLQKFDFSTEINKSEENKTRKLLDILGQHPGKTLIYAGTFKNISHLSNVFIASYPESDGELLKLFSQWLSNNYSYNWNLTNLAKRGIGIHNGRLHRSLGQIQIRLFEESENGLKCIVSTSSIIEGVNTSAENIILWSNKNGTAKINDFTYKNIIGRGGRMFRHFVGKIFILDRPPEEQGTQLTLDIPDEVLGTLEYSQESIPLTSEQIAKIIAYKEEMGRLIGSDNFKYIDKYERFSSSDTDVILEMAKSVSENPLEWSGLMALNSKNLDYCGNLLYKLIKLKPNIWGHPYTKVIAFIKILVNNWDETVPEMLDELEAHDIDIDDFFQLERVVSFTISSLISDVVILYNRTSGVKEVNLSAAISNFSNCFLPPLVFHLEEYGLPRMISRKIQKSGIYNFEENTLEISQAIDELIDIGYDRITERCRGIDEFDGYILKYFFDGVKQK